MGALDYALAGAVKGGADTFLEISKEERGEEREIKKEKRLNSFQEIRDKRLAEINAGERELDREQRSEQSKLDRESRTANVKTTVDARAKSDKERLEFDQSKPMTETTSRGAQTKQYDPETKTWKVVTDQPYDDGTLGGWEVDAVDKEFDSKADTYFGSLDKSGILSAFDSDEKASMAGRAASIASTTWRKYGGRINPNTIWTEVFETIKGGKVQLDAKLDAIDAEIQSIPEEAWYKFDEVNRANAAKKGKLEDKRSDISQAERGNIDSITLGGDSPPGTGGMLPPVPDADPIPVKSIEEAMKLAPGTRIKLPDGRLATVPEPR